MKALLDKFSDTQNHIEDITLIKSDQISNVYFCVFNGIKAVIKEDKPFTKKIGLNRKREASLLNAISHSCSCPNIVFNDLSAGIIIWEYIEGGEAESKLILNKDFLIKLGRKVKNIHITDTTTLSSYNFLDFIEHYKNIIKDSKFAVDINNLISKLYNPDTQLTLCHNDLTKPNILVGDAISFIDWEYASLNDPHYDIATVFQAYNLNASQRDAFLIGYNSAHIDLVRVSQFIALTKLTDRLWGRAIDTLA
jgi:thiamine kinase-like enzyme